MRNLSSLRVLQAGGQLVCPVLESNTQFVPPELQLRVMKPFFEVEERAAEVVYYSIQFTHCVKETVRVHLDAFQLEWIRAPEMLSMEGRRRIMLNGRFYWRLFMV